MAALTAARVEALALALPAATKVIQWGGHDVYKIGGEKVFAICGGDSLSFKVTEIGFVVLTDGGPARQAPYLAKGQWVIVDLADVEEADVGDWLKTSHALVAAKLTKKRRAELGV